MTFREGCELKQILTFPFERQQLTLIQSRSLPRGRSVAGFLVGTSST